MPLNAKPMPSPDSFDRDKHLNYSTPIVIYMSAEISDYSSIRMRMRYEVSCSEIM